MHSPEMHSTGENAIADVDAIYTEEHHGTPISFNVCKDACCYELRYETSMWKTALATCLSPPLQAKSWQDA
jgi:hypothetical protein